MLCRALIRPRRNRDIILLDSATDHLDEDNEAQVLDRQHCLARRPLSLCTRALLFKCPFDRLRVLSINIKYVQVLHLLREQLAKSDAVGVITCERVGNIADDDWVIVMKGGVVVQSGTHRLLIEERGCYRDMHGISDPLYPFPTAASEAHQGHGLPPNLFHVSSLAQTGNFDVDGNPLDGQWDDPWTPGEEWGSDNAVEFDNDRVFNGVDSTSAVGPSGGHGMVSSATSDGDEDSDSGEPFSGSDPRWRQGFHPTNAPQPPAPHWGGSHFGRSSR